MIDKSTPRPWFLHDFTGAFEAPTPGDVTISCDHPATITVASMGRALTGTLEEARANAALIFHAVTARDALVAALRNLLRAPINGVPLREWEDPFVIEALAALKLAGET